MSLELGLAVRAVDVELVLRRPQPGQLVVVVERRVVQRGQRLPVRVGAEVLERPVVLLLRRALGRVVERRREVRRLEVGLQRLVVHRGRRPVGAAVAAAAGRVARARRHAPAAVAGVCVVRRTSTGQPDAAVTRQALLRYEKDSQREKQT